MRKSAVMMKDSATEENACKKAPDGQNSDASLAEDGKATDGSLNDGEKAEDGVKKDG